MFGNPGRRSKMLGPGPATLDLRQVPTSLENGEDLSQLLSEKELRELLPHVRRKLAAAKQTDSSTALRWGSLRTTESRNDTFAKMSRDIKRLIERVVQTSIVVEISSSHRVASYNVLSAFIDGALKSGPAELREFCSAPDMCLRVFTVYIERSDQARLKAMKLLLSSLSLMLSQGSVGSTTSRVMDIISRRLVSILFSEEAYSRVKPAFQAFELFLQKDVLRMTDALALFQKPDQSIAMLAPSKGSTLEDDARSANRILAAEGSGAVPPTTSRIPWRDHSRLTHTLLCRLVQWMSDPHVAPAAGTLFVAVVAQLCKGQVTKRSRETSPTEPIWVHPLLDGIQAYSGLMDSIRQHLLPKLFESCPQDIGYLLDRLPLTPLLAGGVMKDDPQTQFLFVVLQVGKEAGLVHEPGQWAFHSAHCGPSNALQVSKARIQSRAEWILRAPRLASSWSTNLPRFGLLH